MPSLTAGEGDDRVGPVFAALADPTRLAIVHALAERTAVTASGLAAELPVSRQAVAKHLATLDGAGLVAARREGRETRYRLTPAPMEDAIAWMTRVGSEWDDRLRRLREHTGAPSGSDR